ncbi:MAG: hypothetical protein FWH27_16745, partial [Planctomycetaceae bacterium]|nr:hypothetical protein [Planctomycetaceae bacterium]
MLKPVISLLTAWFFAVLTMPQIVCAALDANTAKSEWRWSPYSVGLCLVIDDSIDDHAAIEHDTMTALLRWQSNWLNGICDFQPEASPVFSPTWEQYDKLFLIAVTQHTILGWSATIRECDVRTRTFGGIQQVNVAQLSQLPEHLFCEITEMLTPLARIVRVDENRVLLEERAGELLAMQDVLPAIAERQVLLPIVRSNDRDGNPQQIRRIDWTFLPVDRNTDGLLSTTMHTGLRSPINTRIRLRHQQLALLAKPVSGHTTIHFASYVSQDMPLPVCDILESVPGKKQAVNIGTTNTQGEFRVDYLPERPVRLLYVRNGTNLIARVSVMPGVDPALRAEVPIADSTLHAESLVLGIQEEILDTVATRQILVAQAITYRQRSDRKSFDDTLLKLRRLKTQQVYQSELNLLRMQLPYDDPVSRRRIEAMLEQTRTLVRESLPPVEVPWTTR